MTAQSTGRAAPQQWSPWPRTLTARLVIGVVMIVVVVVTLTGTLTAVLLEKFLRDRLDQQLLSTANPTQVAQLAAASTTHQNVELPTPQQVYLALYDTSGTALSFKSGSQNLVAMTLSGSQSSGVLRAQHGRPKTVVNTDNERLRAVWLVIRVTNAQTGQLMPARAIIGLSEHEVDLTMHRVLLLELLIGAAAVVVAFGVTATGLTFSLRPLRRVTRTAQEVTRELSPEGAGLQRRVSSTDTTTEVGQLAESFNTMLDEVQAQFAARRDSENRMRQFLADASHELRTPLTSIRGYAELARLRGSTDLDDTIGRIETEGTRMSRLVEDLLLLARGDDEENAGAPVRVPVDLAEVAEDAADGVRAAHPARSIEVRAVPGAVVLGDPDQLLRVARNLITNAAVHTAVEAPITVETERADGLVALRVTDAGPGLRPEELPHVFERFWRADRARSRARGGTGLGLAIVAQIVHAHGGDAMFESSAERGSVVTLRLPAAEPAAVRAESGP